MKIATYNANSVRKRLPLILDWLAENEPDVLALQETKCEDAKFPVADFEDLGYHVAIHGQKSYNGVALIARAPIQDVRLGLEHPNFPEDCRVLRAIVGGVGIINTYVPNGTKVGTDKFAYKLAWYQRFRELIQTSYRPDDPVIWLGDMNIAPTPDDVWDSKKMYGGVGHHPDEFVELAATVDWGWTDLFRKFTAGPGHYTYFDYFVADAVSRGRGWRIDHIYATPSLAAKTQTCRIDLETRTQPEPSDHALVYAEFGT